MLSTKRLAAICTAVTLFGALIGFLASDRAVEASGVFALPATVVQTNQPNTYSNFLQDLSGAKQKPPASTVAGLPAAASNSGAVYLVTDGATANDCTTGLGSTRVWCASNGSAWGAIGGASAGSGTVNTGTAGQFAYYAAGGTAVSGVSGAAAHGVMLYEGTSAPTSTPALAVDSLLQGQGSGADPAGVAVGNCATALTYSTSSHMFGCTTTGPSANQNIRSVGAAFSGGGLALTVGTVAYITVPPACTIAAWNITIDTGTISFDVWKVATGTAIPTVANTIMTGGFLSVSSGTAIHSTTLTNFTTTSVAANDIFGFEVEAVSSATLASINLQCNATT